MKEGNVLIDNTAIDYVTFGKGKNPLILIPGLSLRDVKGSGLALSYMYRIFSRDFQVFCIDRRRDIPEGYTNEQIAEDVANVMQKLGLEKACVLGVSQGGMVGQYLTLNHPELVQKLVIGVSLSRNNPTVLNCINGWVKLAEEGKYGELSIDLLKKMYSDSYIKKYRWLFPLLSKISKPKNPNRFVTLAKAALTCNTYEGLGEITCPVFVIGGKKDQVLTGDASLEIANKLKCPVYLYENLGHSAYDEAKDFNRRVLDFFIDISSPPHT